MSMPYLEKCKDIIAGLDVDVLSSISFNETLGSGSGFEFRSLGQSALTDMIERHVGIKVPNSDRRNVRSRFIGEASLISLILDSSPELESRLSSFMALVTIAGDIDPRCIATEDASEGGQKAVQGRPASQEARHLLYEPFRELGSFKEVISEEECDYSLAFDVNGSEKLLDFTPNPINLSLLYSYAPFQAARSATVEAIPDLTITLPRESTLAQQLINLTNKIMK